MGEHKRKKGRSNPGSGRQSKGKLAALVIAAVVVAVFLIKYYQKTSSETVQYFPSARTLGEADAPLKIVEFADLQCSHCAEGVKVLKEFMEKHPGSIQLTFKYFPLGALNSTISAQYAECAALQNKFWPFAELAFENQDRWRTALDVRPLFNDYAKRSGVDLGRLAQCVQSKDVEDTLQREKAEGNAKFVRSTPTYFINDKMVVGIIELKKALEQFLVNNP